MNHKTGKLKLLSAVLASGVAVSIASAGPPAGGGAAPAAGGGHGGAAVTPSGGGGSVNTGGGGAVKAPAAPATPAVNPGNGGGIVAPTPSNKIAPNPVAGRAVAPNSPVTPTTPSVNTPTTPGNNTGGQTVVTGQTTNTEQHWQHGEHGFHNPYVPNPYRNGNQYYGVIYGYPWAPFSYGWGGGYYGYGGYTVNYGYPNGGYSPFLVSYDGYGNAAGTNQTNATPAQPQQPLVQQPVAPQRPAAPTPTNLQAVATNAVDQSPAMAEANGEMRKAQTAYDAERARVLNGLRDKPEYKKALADRQAASHEVALAKKDAGGTPSPAVVDAAAAKLEAADEVTKMEEQAIATDPGASAAKSALDKATTDRNVLRARLMADVKGQMAMPK